MSDKDEEDDKVCRTCGPGLGDDDLEEDEEEEE